MGGVTGLLTHKRPKEGVGSYMDYQSSTIIYSACIRREGADRQASHFQPIERQFMPSGLTTFRTETNGIQYWDYAPSTFRILPEVRRRQY